MAASERKGGGSGPKRRFRLTPGTLLGGVAVFIALGGTSVAASGLINGSKIKPGTVTAKQIRNKTITKAKLSPKTVSQLRGATGPAGPAALPKAYEAESDQVVFPSNAGAVVLAEMELPPGRYMVTATAVLRFQAAAETSCWVTFDHGDNLDTSNWTSPGNLAAGTLSMTGISPAGTELLTLNCDGEDRVGISGRNKLVAIPVAG